MRKILLAITLLLAPSAFSAQGAHVNTSVNSLASTYATTFPGLFLTAINPTMKHLYVANSTNFPIALSFTASSAAVAPSNNPTNNPLQIYVASQSNTQLNFLGGAKYIWLRNDFQTAAPTTVSAGDVIVDTW